MKIETIVILAWAMTFGVFSVLNAQASKDPGIAPDAKAKIAAPAPMLSQAGGAATTQSLPTRPKSPDLKAASQPGGAAFTNSLGMKFVRIAAGEFDMGSPKTEAGREDDEVLHRTKITKPFMLGAVLVTRGEFAAFVKDSAYRTDAEKDGWGFALNGTNFEKVKGVSWRNPGFEQTDDHPVVEVSWNDAQAFCQWLSRKEGKKYRLPSEAEWEYACRAGTQTAYFWGDNPDGGAGFANCADLNFKEKFPIFPSFNWRDGFVFTSPVGSFKPNAWGLYDMSGNAWEWCNDIYGPYGAGEAADPTGPNQGAANAAHVLRGGSWQGHPRSCRAGYRYKGTADYRYSLFGFRLAMDLN